MPEQRWDLGILYPGFDARFQSDLATAVQRAETLAADAQAGRLDLDALFQGYEQLAELSDPADYLDLVLLTETESKDAREFSQRTAAFRRTQAGLKSAFMRKTAEDGRHATLWRNWPQYRGDCDTMAAHLLPAAQENTVRTMQQNGSHAWQALHNSLDAAAGAELSLEGGTPKRYTLAALRNLATHPSPAVRSEAFEAELACYKTYDTPMAACLNGVKGEGMSLAPLRRFDSVLDQMLHENRMDRPTLNAMFAALKKHLPLFRGFLKKKAKLLGHSAGLPYYDLVAPAVDGAPQYTFDEAEALLTDVFTGFSPALGGLFQRAFQEGWMDTEPRTGKVGGALCFDLPRKGQSRVLASFSGSFMNVRTMAHEMGHAFHGQNTIPVPALFRDAPTPICESAAIFNETVLQQAVAGTPGNHRALVEAGLSEATQTIVDIYSRYLFEDAVFAIRQNRPLDSAELCDLMRETQLEAYGDALDPQRTHPYMWMCKPHYYIPDYHYYNFPYIFGLLFAKGLYSNYLAGPDTFMDRYKAFLAKSCAGSVHDIALRIGIDVHDPAFWERAFAVLEGEFALFV